MTIRKRRSFGQIAADNVNRPVEQIIAAVNVGHTMDGMPLTARDIAALRRVDAGETTTEDEIRRHLAELTDGGTTPGHA